METRRAVSKAAFTTPCHLAVLVLVLASSGRAQTRPTTRPSIQRMFANLANADERMREAARMGLMRLTRNELPELRDIVQKARPLRPAQAAALREIVQEIYLADEPYPHESNGGFLGIMMDDSASMVRPEWSDDQSSALGVIVADRVPGFCAARWLLNGDVILGTTSPLRIFKAAIDLQMTISTLPAGSTVRLLVLRRGQVIEIPLTLNAIPAGMKDPDQRAAFRASRQKRFEDYWNSQFEPVLHDNVG